MWEFLEFWSTTEPSLDLHMCPKDLASKVIVLLRKSFMFIIDFKTNKFYSYMLRGSSRCVRGSDIARNIISGSSRKQFLRGSIRGSCGWKLCGSPPGTWGLRQAVLKGINDTVKMYLVSAGLFAAPCFCNQQPPLFQKYRVEVWHAGKHARVRITKLEMCHSFVMNTYKALRDAHIQFPFESKLRSARDMGNYGKLLQPIYPGERKRPFCPSSGSDSMFASPRLHPSSMSIPRERHKGTLDSTQQTNVMSTTMCAPAPSDGRQWWQPQVQLAEENVCCHPSPFFLLPRLTFQGRHW